MSAPFDPKSPSMRLWHRLLAAGASEDEATELMNGYAHELAEQQRAHIPYGPSGHSAQVSWHRHVLYGMAGETTKAQEALDALEQGIVKELTDLIDPSAGSVRPDEEPT